jgi:sRNA-binding regulator protein Hfq
MHRFLASLAVGLGLVLTASATHAELDSAVAKAMLEQSKNEKKGVTVFLTGGEKIAIVVTAISTDTVEGRNQEFSKVLIDLDEVVALALQ